ncbi:hypothetical protein E3N88_01663 [Mikania micrantha]|uniref:Uncharacterized protein n=1 Tax=Mikania micrantha TaxID=192012 RepID=A0A5N6Q3B6_9ASTR|nr:hypothetical protein E3N88_01663 [Mikania micrantha]
MAFQELFLVALIPVLKTLLISVVGLLLAVPRFNILGDAARHHFNNVSQSEHTDNKTGCVLCLNPALVGSSLADTMVHAGGKHPSHICIGSGLGWGACKSLEPGTVAWFSNGFMCCRWLFLSPPPNLRAQLCTSGGSYQAGIQQGQREFLVKQ